MENIQEQIIRTEYSDVMQKSYIDYAMSVIIARAIPDVRDGLKPVQRRTLMICMNWELSMTVLIVNVPVLWGIPWVNIIRMVTVLFMNPWW